MHRIAQHSAQFGTRRLAVVAALVLSLSAAPAALLSGQSSAVAAPQRPHVVGKLPVALPPGLEGADPQWRNISLMVNPASRRAYQFYRVLRTTLVPPGSNHTTWVTTFDLDTLEVLGQVEVPGLLFGSGALTIDAAGGRLFLQNLDHNGHFKGVAVLDEGSFGSGNAAGMRYLPAPSNPAYVALPAGMRYEPTTGKLLLLLNPQRLAEFVPATQGNAPVYANFVVQWDPSAPLTNGAAHEDWTHLLRTCNNATLSSFIADTATPLLSPDGKAVRILCGFGDAGAQLVQVTDPGTNSAVEQSFAQVTGVRRVFVDAARQRVHIAATTGAGSYIATFDWATQRLIGTSVMSPATNIARVEGGVDETTGRLYFSVPATAASSPGALEERGGLITIDGRRTPLPQALAFRDLAMDPLVSPVQVDYGVPGGSRLFVRPAVSAFDVRGTPQWVIIKDTLPPTVDVAAGQKDPTVDVDEVDGKTDRSYAGEAGAYGLRYLGVGGFGRGGAGDYVTPCWGANREIVTGYVERSGLSSVASSARAHVVEADLGTQADARDASRCYPQTIFNVAVPGLPQELQNHPGEEGWQSSVAECSGSSDETTTAENGEAVARCQQDKESLNASGTYAAVAPASSPVSVAYSVGRTELVRDPAQGGLVVESHATAEGITIAGVGSIDRVQSVAKSRANGRVPEPGAWRTEWDVEICGIETADMSHPGCRKGDDLAPIITALNSAGRGRIVFLRPNVDEELRAGTPRGYLAAVQRDRGEASIAKIETGDGLLMVPGLEIQVRRSNEPVNRAIFQLAGVRTVSAYGIFVLPNDIHNALGPLTGGDIPDGAEVVQAPEFPGGVSNGGGSGSDSKASSGLHNVMADFASKVVRFGFGFMFRPPGETLMTLGILSTFGIPAYLAIRRRRLQVVK